jgi:hypothetical protein
MFPKPEIIGRAHAYRSTASEYDQLTLVGHSEGGLLLRMVILEAAERDATILNFMREAKYSKQIQPISEGVLKSRLSTAICACPWWRYAKRLCGSAR